MRKLSEEQSPYLKAASRQKVNWLPYCEEAFQKAREEGKPVFLSSGAGWCHWCHVQAEECFEDKETADLLNRDFVCIKVDRDLRPDIDRRYQEALAAMGQGGGWPLSIFLTQDGKPFYGGTYFPPEDRMGMKGFKSLLVEVAKFYRESAEGAGEFGQRIIEHLKKSTPLEKTKICRSSLDDAARGVLADFDPRNGGFGRYPKFPMPGAMSFLAGRFFPAEGRNPAIGQAVEKTLLAMAKGGIHDQLGGGFHRYSTDAAWIIPHFEKLAEDNAWLLMNYIEGFHLFGTPLFKKTAMGIAGFVKTVLSDPEGGFYASQDADVTPGEEGGYFTWSRDDFKEVLKGDELTAASMHYLHELGAMPKDGRHVLFIAMGSEDISEKTGVDISRVNSLIESAKVKLLAARSRRQKPSVDKTLYSSLNGLFIQAYFSAWRAFEDSYFRDFALMTLKGIMAENFRDGVLYRSPEGAGVGGMLDDYVHMTGAHLDAYENTGDNTFLTMAERLAASLSRDFRDGESGGFFDSSGEVAGLRFKNIEDIPHPSSNALLIWHLTRLSAMTGKDVYMKMAEESLEIFSCRAKGLGVHAGAFFFALDGFFNYLSLKVEAGFEGPLAQTARNTFRPQKIILYGALPEGGERVTPCMKGGCLEAVSEAAALAKAMGGP